ncbi:hypothetical protein ACFL27_22330, partial [candidate division CSSED10-310 bacterium]
MRLVYLQLARLSQNQDIAPFRGCPKILVETWQRRSHYLFHRHTTLKRLSKNYIESLESMNRNNMTEM